MSWLLGVVTKNPYILAVIFVAGLATGAVPAWKYQAALKDAAVSKYNAFVGETKTLGDAAKKAAADQAARDKLNKENDDEMYTKAIINSLEYAGSLLDARTRSGYLPAASTGSKHPDRACFNRLQLGSAIQQLDTEVQGLITKGDSARIGLDTAKAWVKMR